MVTVLHALWHLLWEMSACTAAAWSPSVSQLGPLPHPFTLSSWRLELKLLYRPRPIPTPVSPWLFPTRRRGHILGGCAVDPALASLHSPACLQFFLCFPSRHVLSLLSPFLSLTCSRPTSHRPLLLCLRCLLPNSHMFTAWLLWGLCSEVSLLGGGLCQLSSPPRQP